MAKLWGSKIEVGGNPRLAAVVNASLASLLETARSDVYYSTSPGGLATNGYNGHSFWDVETWMWPTYLALYPEIAKAMLKYRADRLPEAKANALLNNFSGAMFPWESAFSGTEVDPAQGTTTEEHLQSDIALAFRQYYEATGDVEWLKTVAWPVLEGIADFWVSKAIPNTDGTYSIPHIVGPDEYHTDVTDSVYCNAGAQISLNMAYDLAKAAGQEPKEHYKTLAGKLRILVNNTSSPPFHPEYENYTRGTVVKQADTILLGYPLLVSMPKALRSGDLEVYANVSDPAGPAMTWSMFSVNFRDVGDLEQADAFFTRGYVDNAVGDFLEWHEGTHASGSANFLTGAGGFLQSVWAGYGGMRFINGTLVLQNPSPLPGSTSLALRSVYFRGVKLDIVIEETGWSVAVVGTPGQALEVESGGKVTELSGKPVRFPARSSAVVRPIPHQVFALV